MSVGNSNAGINALVLFEATLFLICDLKEGGTLAIQRGGTLRLTVLTGQYNAMRCQSFIRPLLGLANGIVPTMWFYPLPESTPLVQSPGVSNPQGGVHSFS